MKTGEKLPENNSHFASQNRPSQKEINIPTYSNHPFSGVMAVSFREGTSWFSRVLRLLF